MVKKNKLSAVLAVVGILASPAVASANTDQTLALGSQQILHWANIEFFNVQKARAISVLRMIYGGPLALAGQLANRALEKPIINTLPSQAKEVASARGLLCPEISIPSATLSTTSKYDQNDASRSDVDGDSAEIRKTILRPIRKSISELSQMITNDEIEASQLVNNAKCFQQNLARWADGGALTHMESADAYLTRDRFVSEIALNLLASQKLHRMAVGDQKKISKWLSSIAATTIEFYQFRAGDKVKINNHRYWAGLAVGSVGYAISDKSLKQWGASSYQIGVCQVDAAGYLPLELGRGELALDYHIYALRPLQAFSSLASGFGDKVDGKCGDGLKRLREQTVASISDPSAISVLTGLKQGLHAKEKSYSKPLQLVSLGLN
jgi:hypothetical protein